MSARAGSALGLPAYLDDAVLGLVLLRREKDGPRLRVLDANLTAADLLGVDRSDLRDRPLESIPGLERLADHWTVPRADGESPVVVRARVGPGHRRGVEATLAQQSDDVLLLQLMDLDRATPDRDAVDTESDLTDLMVRAVASRALSYELQTPLASVMGCTELLLEDHAEGLTDRQRSLVGSIDRNGRRLRALLLSLLELAGSDGDELAPRRSARRRR